MPGDWHLPSRLFLTHKVMIQKQDTRLSLMSSDRPHHRLLEAGAQPFRGLCCRHPAHPGTMGRGYARFQERLRAFSLPEPPGRSHLQHQSRDLYLNSESACLRLWGQILFLLIYFSEQFIQIVVIIFCSIA